MALIVVMVTMTTRTVVIECILDLAKHILSRSSCGSSVWTSQHCIPHKRPKLSFWQHSSFETPTCIPQRLATAQVAKWHWQQQVQHTVRA